MGPSASAAKVIVLPMRTRRSRREWPVFSDIAFPHFFSQVLGRSPRESNNAQRDVLVRLAHEGRGVAHEKILHVMRLAVLVQRGGLRVLAHPYGPRLVNDDAAR